MNNLTYNTDPTNILKFFQNMFTSQIGEINIGASGNPELELEIVEKTASYGRQLGWIIDALVIVAEKIESSKTVHLSKEEQAAFTQLYAMKNSIDDLKRKSIMNACPLLENAMPHKNRRHH